MVYNRIYYQYIIIMICMLKMCNLSWLLIRNDNVMILEFNHKCYCEVQVIMIKCKIGIMLLIQVIICWFTSVNCVLPPAHWQMWRVGYYLPLLHRYSFWRINNRQLLKTLWEKKILLIMSNFFFSHNVFYSIRTFSRVQFMALPIEGNKSTQIHIITFKRFPKGFI